MIEAAERLRELLVTNPTILHVCLRYPLVCYRHDFLTTMAA